MPFIISLVGLLAWSSISVASTFCAQNGEIVRTCFAQWSTEFEEMLGRRSPRMSDAVPLLISEARSRTEALNRSGPRVRQCFEREVEFDLSCTTSSEREHYDEVIGELDPLRERLADVHEEAKNTIYNLLIHANLQLKDWIWTLNCPMRAYAEGGYQICIVVDRSSSEYRFHPLAKANELPISVGITDLCTFFEDSQGRLFSADHCGTEHMRKARLFTSNPVPLNGAPQKRFHFSQSAFESGETLEDLAIFTQPTPGQGKPFYFLTLDRNLSRGCEVRSNSIVACSLKSLKEISGKRAESVGFPGTHYAGTTGEFSRDAPLSALWTRGVLTFDALSERFFVQMYTQPGSSGAPVYLPANTHISGMIFDRPLVLGLVSGFAGEDGPLPKSGLTDNVVVVALLKYPRLTELLK